MSGVSEKTLRRACPKGCWTLVSALSHRINPGRGKTGMVVLLEVHCLSCLGKRTQHLLRYYLVELNHCNYSLILMSTRVSQMFFKSLPCDFIRVLSILQYQQDQWGNGSQYHSGVLGTLQDQARSIWLLVYSFQDLLWLQTWPSWRGHPSSASGVGDSPTKWLTDRLI